MQLNIDILKNLETELGESWYILDEQKFTENYRRLLKEFSTIYPNTHIAYSYKTNYIPQLCKIVNSEGGYAEVVSEMEYDLAIKIGTNPIKIVVNGPYKPAKALKKFLLNGSIVNLDSYSELDELKSLVKEYPNKKFNLGVRCNFPLTGEEVSRFGFDITDKKFESIFDFFGKSDNIDFKILHCHYPNRDVSLFRERTEKMLEIYDQVSKYATPTIIDIGGGLGGNLDEFIRQQLNMDIADYPDYARMVATRINSAFAKSANKPALMIEPGTALVADTLKFVCKVIDIKSIRGQKIAMTSGTKINFMPMASNLSMPMKVYSEKIDSSEEYSCIDISGYTCMENDYLFKNYKGKIHKNDYLVFDNVGSYSVVFKPPFILPNVPVVSLKDNEIEVLKESESFEYIFSTYKM